MQHLSFWEKEIWFRHIDYLIVGGGIVGLTSAIEIKRKEPIAKVLVVEKGFLPSGASSKNAGFACFGSIGELLQDLKNIGEDATMQLVLMRWQGLNKLRSLLGDKALGYEDCGNVELFLHTDEEQQAKDHIHYFNQLFEKEIGQQVYEPLPENQFGLSGIMNRFEGQINTGTMIANLQLLAAQHGVLMLNGMSIKDFHENDNHVVARLEDELKIKTNHLLIATNGFASQLLPDLDVEPGRAQVLITKPIENLPFQGAYHLDKGYYYFRNVGNRVLLGGGRNLDFKGEKTYSQELTYPVQDKLEELLNDFILKDIPYEIDTRWAGTLGLGKNRQPIIKQVSNRVFCAVRMGGMGVAIGSLVGEKAAEMVLGA